MRRSLPPWAMGLAIAPLGFYFGFVSTAMPILLAAKGVAEEAPAEIGEGGELGAALRGGPGLTISRVWG